MFNEKSPIWIKIYKVLVIISTIAILIGGFIWAQDEARGWYSFDFGEFIIYFALFATIATVDLVSGMLVVNFLNNVQVIRENLEQK